MMQVSSLELSRGAALSGAVTTDSCSPPLGITSGGTQEGGGCSLFFHVILLNSPGFAKLAALLEVELSWVFRVPLSVSIPISSLGSVSV